MNCKHEHSRVIDTRKIENGYRRRRYYCDDCDTKYSTIEVEFELTKGKSSIERILETASAEYTGLSPKKLSAVRQIIEIFLDG
jgi:transcriptional regulator NrdR family protein